MKKLQKMKLRTLILLGLLMYSCQNQDDFYSEIEQPVTEIDTSKLIDFKGLPVNHRFKTPVKDLEIKHTEENLKQMYRASKRAVAKRKGLASKTDNAELPNAAIIAEATQKVVDLFPYKKVEEELEEQNTEELDSIQLLEIERLKQIKFEKEAQEHLEMIKQDFPTLTETEIEENIELIDEYYSQNLDYIVLDQIAENEEEYAGKFAAKNTYWCVYKKIVSIKWGFARATYAMFLAATRASTSAGNYYPDDYGSYYGYVGGGGTNTRGDAYRHILWNALLADYYFTVSSKNPRVAFAKAVADSNEECNNDNAVDSEAMDYHNNAIGRKIWYDNTRYRKTWFGWIYGLNTPSTSRIKNLVRKTVDEKSCFIVKESNPTDFPNNLLRQHQTAAQIKAKILTTDANTAVYFEGTISTSTAHLPVNKYDYSNCTSEDLPWTEERIHPTWTWLGYPLRYTWYAPCVQKRVPACYKL